MISAAPLLDLLYPAECARCRAATTGPWGLCPDCWAETAFITGPKCVSCGVPLPTAGADPDPHCEGCTTRPPAWERGRAAVLYTGAGREVVLKFKHADRLDLAPVLARWLARAAPDLLAEADLAAPVPLHWLRLWSRRYNQAAELVRRPELGLGRRAVPDLLVRRRNTRTLKGANRDARHAALHDAIAVARQHRDRIRGKRVLIVDDVMTTGATLSACAEACRAAGAAHVDVLAVARVAREDFVAI